MRRILPLSILLALSIGTLLAPAVALADSDGVRSEVAASEVLDFTATALDGSEFDLSTLAGRVVLLDFWGTWCAPCIHAFPKLNRLHEEFGDRLTVVGLAFYSGEIDTLAGFVAEHDLGYTVLAGAEESLGRFEILAFPSYVLVSAEGEVLWRHAGQAPDLYERVAALMNGAGAAQAPAVASAD